jgi:hypothetical protein
MSDGLNLDRRIMAIIYVILGILAAGIGYLLFAPFYLEINTRNLLFRLRFHRIGTARLNFRDNSLLLHWSVLGMGKEIDLLAVRKEGTKKRSQQSKTSIPPRHKILAVLESFKLNKFSLQLDTGDMALNGLLFPWFMGAGCMIHRKVGINFADRNELILEIENNALRMVRAYLFTNTKQ